MLQTDVCSAISAHTLHHIRVADTTHITGPLVNTDVNTPNACTGAIEYSSYNTYIHTWVCILFVVLFGLSSAAHLVQAIMSRRWYLLGTIFICAITETLGVGLGLSMWLAVRLLY